MVCCCKDTMLIDSRTISDKDQSIGQSEMQQLLTKYLEEFTEARKSQPKSDPSTHASIDHPVTTADSNDPLLPRSGLFY